MYVYGKEDMYQKWIWMHFTKKTFLLDALMITGLILSLRPANKRWRYFVMMSLNGWVQT